MSHPRMKAAKTRLRAVRYKPVRVLNITSRYHTTRLYPCQQLLLKLRKPYLFIDGNFSAEAGYKVTLFSDFLVMEDTADDGDGNCVYTFSQKYDLSEWAEYGETCLGEIVLTVVNNTHPTPDEFTGSICVIQEARNSNKVLTVVNPTGVTVKMEPYQFLEVVCSEPEWNDWVPGKLEASGLSDTWNIIEYEDPRNPKAISLAMVNKEVAGDRSEVLTKEEGFFAVKNRFNFKVNPFLPPALSEKIEEEIRKKRKPLREHHFWFYCTQESLEKIEKSKNDIYNGPYINFEGSCNNEESTWRGVEVKMAVHGKNKHLATPFYLRPGSEEYKKEITKRSEERSESYPNEIRLLTNPVSSESIDFCPGYEEVIIEVVQPNAIWPELPEDAKWEFYLDNSRVVPKHIKLIPLGDTKRWNKRFQRIKIEQDYDSKVGKTGWLGAIIVVCQEKQDVEEGKRRISCWWHPINKTHSVSKGISKVTRATSESRTNHSCSSIYSNRDKDRPQVCTVEFSEIFDKTLAGTARTRRVFDIPFSVRPRHEFDYYNCPKKKEASSTSDCKNHSFRSLEVLPKESKNDSRGNETEKQGNNTEIDSLHIYDPSDFRQITIKPKQSLHIRLRQPLTEPKEFWTVSVRSSGNAMKIEHCRSILVRDTPYQEVKIVSDVVPPVPGVYKLGYVNFHCTETVKTISVYCEVKSDNEGYVVSVPKISAARVVTGRLISDWVHNEAVIVKLEEAIYVKSPCNTSDWAISSWEPQVEQFLLPPEAWKHPILRDKASDIDHSSPWLTSFSSFVMANAMIFRSLAMQQPYLKQMLQAIADVTTQDILPLFKVTFVNRQHAMSSEVETAFGKVSAEYKLERTIIICADIKKYREQVCLNHPKSKEQVEVKPNQTLVVNLAPQFQGDRQCLWYTGHWPSFLDYITSKMTNGEQQFFYQVRADHKENKDERLTFICNNSELEVTAKYKKV